MTVRLLLLMSHVLIRGEEIIRRGVVDVALWWRKGRNYDKVEYQGQAD